MKKVIREGVFETNSSSTHAVAFKKRKGNQTEKDSSYEMHTPFFKTLFIIGLCTHAKKFAHAYELDIELDLKEILGEDYNEEHCQAHECEKIEGYEGQCEKFKNAVIKEFIKMENKESYKGIYAMHKYWGKKPFNEISRFIGKY